MKKVLFIAAVGLIFSCSLFATEWKNWEDYTAAKAAKSRAVEAAANGDTTTAVAEYKKAAELAAKSGAVESQAWRLNDAGYTLINEFKKLTGYQEKIDSLATLKPSKDKMQVQAEMAAAFKEYASMLDEAKALLTEGAALYPAETPVAAAEGTTPTAQAVAKKEGPAAKIESNLGFLAWVLDFIDKNYKEGVAAPKKAEAAPATEEAPAAK